MTNDFQVVFHNIDQSDAIMEAVNKRISKLERYCDQIITARVVLDSPHNNHHKGKVYKVGLEIHTSQKEVIVNQEQHDNHAHEDLYVAIAPTLPCGLKGRLVYHRFESNDGSVDYGDEIDGVLSKKFDRWFTLLAKFAYYDGGRTGRADRHRIWLEATFQF